MKVVVGVNPHSSVVVDFFFAKPSSSQALLALQVLLALRDLQAFQGLR